MMRLSILILSLGLATISLVAGWWQAGLSASQLPPNNDDWTEIANANVDGKDYAKIAARLQRSDMFPISNKEAKRLEQVNVNSGPKVIEGVPEFPVIVAASILDGVPYIHLLLDDEALVKAKSGDELKSGWKIISVDSQRVSAVYGDEEQEFWVNHYDKDITETKN